MGAEPSSVEVHTAAPRAQQRLAAAVESAWYPVLLCSDVTRRPVATTLFGRPLVVFRDEKREVHALIDRCPHRSAPLSDGRVRDGTLECPYHGWRFGGDGVCTRVPGLVGEIPRAARVRVLRAVERAGLVFVHPAAAHDDAPVLPPHVTDPTRDVALYRVQVRGPLLDHLENFLDGAHTHFVHRGILRVDRDRKHITATRSRTENGVEVRYDGEGKQNGLVSRFFERARDVSYGRYRFPSSAEVEYVARDVVTYAQTNWYTPRDDGVVHDGVMTLYSLVSTPRGMIPGFVKRLSMAPIFHLVMAQDARIVARTAAHRTRHGGGAVVDTPLDLVAASLRGALESGRVPDDDDDAVVVVEL